MRNWEKKRKNDISEHVLVTHIVCLLIFLMIAFIYFDLQIQPATSNFVKLSSLMVFFCLATVLYISRYLLSKIPALSQVRLEEILLLIIIFPSSLAFIWYSGDFIGAKVLIIIPVIIAATAFGRIAGLGAALLASILMFFIDYKLFPELPADIFQSSLIVSSVSIVLAWLVGGLLEAERKTQQDLVELADYDQLTGLYNHRYLQENIALSLQESEKSGAPLTLAMLDIDQFKYYNTLYGYGKGDQLLAAIGAILAKSLPEPSYAARYGSDEFMLVLPGKEKSELSNITEEIKNLIYQEAERIFPSNHPQPFSISIGTASYPEDRDAALPLIRAAEDDLYRAKYSRGTDYLYQSVLCEINALKITEAFPALQSLISLINLNDRYTFGHSERVMTYALSLAEELHLSQDSLDLLRYGAALHDIGKIKIETNLLNKPGSLNKQEWETMQAHTIWGAQLVETLPAFKGVIPLIRSHHENYDGSGYPDGLKGEETPLLVRILRIADSFDAMTTDRPYRKALSYAEACQELKKNAGTQFDPQLIDPFLASVKEHFLMRSLG
jgi:diguanylate cyclase (GGDEF)-like protein/putative nucleotidyltransferase with HDIG domain